MLLPSLLVAAAITIVAVVYWAFCRARSHPRKTTDRHASLKTIRPKQSNPSVGAPEVKDDARRLPEFEAKIPKISTKRDSSTPAEDRTPEDGRTEALVAEPTTEKDTKHAVHPSAESDQSTTNDGSPGSALAPTTPPPPQRALQTLRRKQPNRPVLSGRIRRSNHRPLQATQQKYSGRPRRPAEHGPRGALRRW